MFQLATHKENCSTFIIMLRIICTYFYAKCT